MKRKWKYALAVVALLIVGLGAVVWGTVAEARAMTLPRYEVGDHRGAAFCGECHAVIYRQWSESRHALATVSEPFHAFRDKFTNDFVFDFMMGESLCYACHGPKSVNEGVNCETCHGPVSTDLSIEEMCTQHYGPGLESMREPAFCGKCHDLAPPMMSVYSEWQRSQAAADGITCRDCHMTLQDGSRYHGFDSAFLDVDIYRGDIEVFDVRLDFPRLHLKVKNGVLGHAIPANGPSRVLALEIELVDRDGNRIHSITEKFFKKCSLSRGLMPDEVLENTQLQSGETRVLEFELPQSVGDLVAKAMIILRFYEVADEHRGELSEAHWASEPFLRQEIDL